MANWLERLIKIGQPRSVLRHAAPRADGGIHLPAKPVAEGGGRLAGTTAALLRLLRDGWWEPDDWLPLALTGPAARAPH